MNVSSLAAAAASPPMSDASAPKSCGTYQVYWIALPSSKPNCPPGSSWDASKAAPAGKLPSAPRAWMEPVAGLNRYSQLAARRLMVEASELSCSADATWAMEKSSMAYSRVTEPPME